MAAADGRAPPAKAAPQATAQPCTGAGPETVDGEKGSRGRGHDPDSGEGERLREDVRDLDLLDPARRHAASLAPPVTSPLSTPPAKANAPLRARTLEELLPALVRRIAWAGDKHKGTAHFELGAGAFAGTTVVVHAEGGRVRVELHGTEGPELDRLRARLDGRLRGHGLDVESVT
jgi:hypothetical protein